MADAIWSQAAIIVQHAENLHHVIPPLPGGGRIRRLANLFASRSWWGGSEAGEVEPPHPAALAPGGKLRYLSPPGRGAG